MISAVNADRLKRPSQNEDSHEVATSITSVFRYSAAFGAPEPIAPSRSAFREVVAVILTQLLIARKILADSGILTRISIYSAGALYVRFNLRCQ